MNSLVNIVILATTYFRDQKTLATVLSPVFVNNVLSEHTYWNTHPLVEKAMAPHSSTLAWKIPWAEEPGRL